MSLSFGLAQLVLQGVELGTGLGQFSGADVFGDDAVALAVGDVVFDALQTGGLWTVDQQGYNFRHEIDVTTAEAFPQAGAHYQVRYQITPAGGQKTIVRFQLRVI